MSQINYPSFTAWWNDKPEPISQAFTGASEVNIEIPGLPSLTDEKDNTLAIVVPPNTPLTQEYPTSADLFDVTPCRSCPHSPASPRSPTSTELLSELSAMTAPPSPEMPSVRAPSQLNPAAPVFEPQRRAVGSEDFLDAQELMTYCQAVGNLEARVLNAFQTEVKEDAAAAFRFGPRKHTIIKARAALAILYQRLAGTIRRLGFHEQAIAVPATVRATAWQEGKSFRPVGMEDWAVGDVFYNTRDDEWSDE